MKTRKIHNVTFIEPDEVPENNYADGAEEKLLSVFQEQDPQAAASALLENNPTWAEKYHLSSIREQLLSWYPFPPDASILEIGAGCGALTGTLCEKAGVVTAVELNPKRAEVIAYRHKEYDNLTVIGGNIADAALETQFDYITLIGVLEYAGKFTEGTDPFVTFLQDIQRYLKKDGTLIIAIENKYGIKYWAGASEDHTAKFFDSIEGYPSHTGVRTFSKPELQTLLQSIGLEKQSFYYPWPDYKMPMEIFSDEYLPSQTHGVSGGMFPGPDYIQQRSYLFDEQAAMYEMTNSHMSDFFSNSFLVFASRV